MDSPALHVHYMAAAAGLLPWMWLMHTRALPLEGGIALVNLVLAAWFYLLVSLPIWELVHGRHHDSRSHDGIYILTGRYAVLSVWVIGFCAACFVRNDEYTPGVVMLAASALALIVMTPPLVPLLPWFELVFGLYIWDQLLEDK